MACGSGAAPLLLHFGGFGGRTAHGVRRGENGEAHGARPLVDPYRRRDRRRDARQRRGRRARPVHVPGAARTLCRGRRRSARHGGSARAHSDARLRGAIEPRHRAWYNRRGRYIPAALAVQRPRGVGCARRAWACPVLVCAVCDGRTAVATPASNARRVKDLPAELRPRERLLRHGPDALSTAELVAVLLRTGSPTRSVIEVASDLIGGHGGLARLSAAGVRELCGVDGVGEVKALNLLAAFELGRRLGALP